MSEININSLTSNNTIIGDGNGLNISPKLYAQNELIRDEADRFNQYNVEANCFLAEGHKNFINELRSELMNYYTVERQSLFLDNVRKGLIKYIDDFKKEAPDNDFTVLQKMLMFLDQEIEELPKIVHINAANQDPNRVKVFISYSQIDKGFLDDLRRHFRPLKAIVDFWDDSIIKPGQQWEKEIEKAMEQAKIAILLVSADFYNSEFVRTKELPRLLNKANDEGATILSVILKPCLFDSFDGINTYQAINSPKKTVISMNETEKEELWVSLVTQIRDIVTSK